MEESQLMQEMLHTGVIHLMQINALHIPRALHSFRKVHGRDSLGLNTSQETDQFS